MAALRPKLTDDGSVLLVIRSHVRDGVVSDYVLRTRLALREDGWDECEELIWLKPDAPPLGSRQRPRRTWEQILWFSRTPKPYINLTGSGTFSDRIGFVGSRRYSESGVVAVGRSSEVGIGHARTPDHFTALVSENENSIRHPAMFPPSLCEKLIRTFSREGDLVVDPFCGSGTTLLAAQELGRKFIGFDVKREYVRIAIERLAAVSDQSSRAPLDCSGPPPKMFRLKPDFPQRPRLRRILLFSKGLNESDLRVFNLILNRTVNSKDRVESVPLSLSEIADLTSFSRRTVIRSVARLRDADMIVTTRDETQHHHEGSLIGPAPGLLLPVVNGDTRRHRVTNARLGDFEPDRIYNLDCIEGMSRLPDSSVDMLLTDLPYGEMTAHHWDCPINLDDLWSQLRRILKPNAPVVMTAATPFNGVLMTSNLSWFRHEWIWHKERATNFLNAKVAPLRIHESVLVFCEGTPTYIPQMEPGEPYRVDRPANRLSGNYHPFKRPQKNGVVTVNDGFRYPKTVLSFPTERDNIHPTQKPVALFEYFLKTYTTEGALVVDICIGGGTTAIAAMNTGRDFLGFELDADIYAKAAKRIRQHARTLRKNEKAGGISPASVRANRMQEGERLEG